jgi:hypothetical protein
VIRVGGAAAAIAVRNGVEQAWAGRTRCSIKKAPQAGEANRAKVYWDVNNIFYAHPARDEKGRGT